MTVRAWNEEDLIARLLAPMAGTGAYGLRDDAATIAPSAGCDLVVTCDTLVAGVHFFPDDAAASVARKALAVNISDLAAKGAAPRGFLLSLALPRMQEEVWLSAFAEGLGMASRAFGCALLGGDTTATPGPCTITVTAFGEVPAGRMVPRTGMRAGDVIGVTGTIGDAALGLLLQTEPRRQAWQTLDEAQRLHLLERYRHPEPRLAFADPLLSHANAGMDVSDGLVGDLAKMLRVSGGGGVLRLADVPLSNAARAAAGAESALLECAFTGGDDYEILFSLPEARWNELELAARGRGVNVTRIGIVTSEPGLVCLDEQGRPVTFSRASYVHNDG